MKILHITPSYKPAFTYGGPTLSVSQLCENQAAIGEKVVVITTTANGTSELPIGKVNIDNVEVNYFKRITGDHTHFSPSLLKFLWKNCTLYDTIHIHSWWNLVSVFATLVCWVKGVKPFLSPRGMLSSFSFTQDNSVKKKMIHSVLGNWLLKKTWLHATSQLEWDDAHRVNLSWKGFILPNIIDLPTQRFSRADDTHSDLRIIYLSRIHPKKGLELAFKALAKCDFPFQLEIYGDGDKVYIQKLKAMAESLGISNSVIWKGWVQGKAKYNALAKSDLFILTSYNENFANVVLESLAVGTPVLVSDQVGMCEYANRMNYGWTASMSPVEIYKQLNEIYKSIKLLKIDIDQVYDDFGGQNLANKYINKYQCALNSTTQTVPKFESMYSK